MSTKICAGFGLILLFFGHGPGMTPNNQLHARKINSSTEENDENKKKMNKKLKRDKLTVNTLVFAERKS